MAAAKKMEGERMQKEERHNENVQGTKMTQEEWNTLKEELRQEMLEEIKEELRAQLQEKISDEVFQEVANDTATKTEKAKKGGNCLKWYKTPNNPLLNNMLVGVVSLVVGIVLLCFFTYGMLFNLFLMERYVNLLIILLLLLMTLPTIIAGGFWKDFTRILSRRQPEQGWKLYELKRSLDAIELLQKQLCYAAVMIVMFQLLGVLYNMSEPAALGPGLANILLTGFYTAIMELLLMPLRVEVKKQIANYMEEE